MPFNRCMMHRGFVALAAKVVFTMALGMWSDQAESGEFLLVRDGKPTATIVIATKAPEPAKFAAKELQGHVRKITGATLPVKTDSEKVEGPRILLGQAPMRLGLISTKGNSRIRSI